MHADTIRTLEGSDTEREKRKSREVRKNISQEEFGKRMLGVHKLMLYNAQIGISNASDS